jgi:hypothetical protein
MTYVINGPANGFGVILGNSTGDDIINAFANMNVVMSQGANDTINLLGNNNTVDLGTFTGVNDHVNLYGNLNFIQGNLTHSIVSVNGGTGLSGVGLDNAGGTTNVSLNGYFNSVALNADAWNTIVGGAGNASIQVGSNFDSDEGQGFTTRITLGGTSNVVNGNDPNFIIAGGLGHDKITLQDGNNIIKEAGTSNVITVGSGTNKIWAGSGADTVNITEGDLGGDEPGTPTPTDNVFLQGSNNVVTMADENVRIWGGTGSGTFTEVKIAPSSEWPTPTNAGNDYIATDGSDNKVTLLDGNNTVAITGSGANTVSLGNGNNSVNVAGQNNTITVGSGTNTIQALGDGNVISAGAGIDKIAVGANATIVGDGLKFGSVIDLQGSNDSVELKHNASATVKDEPTGSGMFLEIDGTANKYLGHIAVQGFGNDLLNGRIDFDGVNGANGKSLDVGANPLNLINVFANMISDGHGGDLIKLQGGGWVDLAGTTAVSTATFV